MSANIHWNEAMGKFAAVYGLGKAAWHGLGDVVSGLLTMLQVIAHIGLDKVLVAVEPFYDALGNETGFYGVKRQDNGVYVGHCSKNYECIQFVDLLPWADNLIGMLHGAHYETAGILGKGEKFWALARIPSLDVILGNDQSLAYLLITTSHDGSIATTAKLTYVRVECQNMLNMALRSNGAEIRIKHTKNAKERMEIALEMFKGIQETGMLFQERFELLANRMLSKEHIEAVLNKLFPKKAEVEGKKTVETRRNNILEKILENYESNDNDAFPEQRGTAYALLNAITDYVDHDRTVRNTTGNPEADLDMLRLEQSVFGTGEAMKTQAFEYILEIASEAPEAPYKNYITRALERGEAERASEAPKIGLLDLILETA
jgi:phage/plasmid-like protein (TIGR03299 family)